MKENKWVSKFAVSMSRKKLSQMILLVMREKQVIGVTSPLLAAQDRIQAFVLSTNSVLSTEDSKQVLSTEDNNSFICLY